VTWRHRIAIVVLTVLASLPIAGSACAMACSSTSSAAARHHGSGLTCDESARPSTDIEIGEASGHGCGTHDTALRQVATTAPERLDVTAGSTRLAIAASHEIFEALRHLRPIAGDTAPQGTTPPTATPLVLRV
jgi:hypothetical protein